MTLKICIKKEKERKKEKLPPSLLVLLFPSSLPFLPSFSFFWRRVCFFWSLKRFITSKIFPPLLLPSSLESFHPSLHLDSAFLRVPPHHHLVFLSAFFYPSLFFALIPASVPSTSNSSFSPYFSLLPSLSHSPFLLSLFSPLLHSHSISLCFQTAFTPSFPLSVPPRHLKHLTGAVQPCSFPSPPFLTMSFYPSLSF